MSFILDALKKSETDRQRQSGPGLYEVRVAPPRNALPLWAIGLAVLLAVNLVIVAWVLLRRPATADTPTAAAQTAGAASANASLPQTTATMVPGTPTAAQQGPVGAPTANAVPVNGMAPTAPLAQTAGMPQQLQGATVANTPVPGSAPVAPTLQQAPNAGTGSAAGESEALRAQADAGGDKLNPDDYAPAADPGPPQPFGNHVARATASGVPLYQDVALNTHLPTLRLDLHVFAAQPQERFVMINMHKLREGDALQNEGVRVESIIPGGVVLSHDGTKFLLPRD